MISFSSFMNKEKTTTTKLQIVNRKSFIIDIVNLEKPAVVQKQKIEQKTEILFVDCLRKRKKETEFFVGKKPTGNKSLFK